MEQGDDLVGGGRRARATGDPTVVSVRIPRGWPVPVPVMAWAPKALPSALPACLAR